MSDEKRNEGQLLTDILGMESLVDEITYKLADEAGDAPTATSILGPFWRKDAPRRKMGKRNATLFNPCCPAKQTEPANSQILKKATQSSPA